MRKMGNIFKLSVLTVLSMGCLSLAQANNKTSPQEANYKKFVSLLGSVKEVGDCATSVSSSGDPGNPDGYIYNILTAQGVISFSLDSPKVTQGRSQVNFDNVKSQGIYSIADMAGWSNLVIYYNLEKKITGLEMYKTIGSIDGEKYETGPRCGIIPQL